MKLSNKQHNVKDWTHNQSRIFYDPNRPQNLNPNNQLICNLFHHLDDTSNQYMSLSNTELCISLHANESFQSYMHIATHHTINIWNMTMSAHHSIHDTPQCSRIRKVRQYCSASCVLGDNYAKSQKWAASELFTGMTLSMTNLFNIFSMYFFWDRNNIFSRLFL